MAGEQPYLVVPASLPRDVRLYLQQLQAMVMELAGYREESKRAVRLAEALDFVAGGEFLPTSKRGSARDGETVRLGKYQGDPVVVITGIEIESGGTIKAEIANLRTNYGEWVFEAVCQCQGDSLKTGKLEYLAVGRREDG